MKFLLSYLKACSHTVSIQGEVCTVHDFHCTEYTESFFISDIDELWECRPITSVSAGSYVALNKSVNHLPIICCNFVLLFHASFVCYVLSDLLRRSQTSATETKQCQLTWHRTDRRRVFERSLTANDWRDSAAAAARLPGNGWCWTPPTPTAAVHRWSFYKSFRAQVQHKLQKLAVIITNYRFHYDSGSFPIRLGK